MSKVLRGVKNVTKGYSGVQIKVREATSNDPWGPTGTQMSEIAQLTYNSSTEFYEIMDMLDKRLNDKGKNWRHVLKALKVLDYCLHEGSELVVTWAKQNVYIIKTLREFMYTDEEGRDVGQNIRVAAKELTSLLLDEERLRAERSDRRTWKSRVTGLEEYGSQPHDTPRRRERGPRPMTEEEDAEYKLALEASKYQEEEDRRRREGRPGQDTEDDDLAKAIKLSKEEEEARRRALEEQNAQSLFDDTPTQTQPQQTGWNQGYQQGSGVDFFGNPIDQSQLQPQPTGFMPNAYTGFQTQPTGYQNGFSNGFGQPQQTGFDAFGQQNMQQQFQPQPTGYNPYAQQQQLQPQPTESPLQAGSNNPWATNNQNTGLSSMAPMKTGSNNPFAQQSSSPFNRPGPSKMPSMSVLNALPEQKTLSAFNQPQPQATSFTPPPKMPQAPSKPISEHEARLNALLSSGEGQDTFGNTGETRIPAQHTAPGTFVNSAGAGANKLTAEATGNNPFLRQQFTGMPTVSYGATGPGGMNGGFGGQGSSNPFGARPQQQGANQGDLIQF
ncbi:enth domain-containing protein [Diaporthe eres]|uniref:ENTH domain-containing protein n=3 Tax=Diaporthe vaccinii TaxID=105482 RepID=A0ABR4EWH7_9PEZI|nr:enth domain-containing protein [Diaporthe eres]